MGQKQKMEREKERKEEDRKLVITMASFALQRHLEWRTQRRLGQKEERLKVGNNNGQLRIASATSSRLGQYVGKMF